MVLSPPAQDVLAGRKTIGKIRGEITVNGHVVDPISYKKLIGYVEQNGRSPDLKGGLTTVSCLGLGMSSRLSSSVIHRHPQPLRDRRGGRGLFSSPASGAIRDPGTEARLRGGGSYALSQKTYLSAPPSGPIELKWMHPLLGVVQEVLDMLELTTIRGEVIGPRGTGLSFEQRKRLTGGWAC